MKIGVNLRITSESLDVAVLAQEIESLGFESLWLPEHAVMPVNAATPYLGSDDGSIPGWMAHLPDPFILLARASAVTRTLKLATGICLVSEHNPLLLAKEIATLDQLSGGRFIFGIGAGWLREETEIMGGNFPRRWSQTREAVLAMKELWTKDEAEYHGKYIDFPPVRCFPKPKQAPHPPILLGGNTKNVFKRVVAWGDGWMPSTATRISPDRVRTGRGLLDTLASEAGRDPRRIEITVFSQPGDPELIERYEEAGAGRVIVSPARTFGDESLTSLEKLAQQVLR